MIDLRTESLIRLEDVRQHIPSGRRGKQLSKSVPFRWASKGVKGIVLETVKVGGARYTTLDALHRFIQHINAPTPPTSEATRPLPSKQVEKELAKRGL